MTAIPDDKLFEHADRVKDKVVVITGAGNGIGKEAAIRFASYGAKIVIGDRDLAGGEGTVREISAAGGEAVCLKCDVTVWDDLVAMFDLAIERFGAVDIVVPNAGVSEIGKFDFQLKDGKPVRPNLTTVNINLIGVIHTSYLAQHYLSINRSPGSLKALVLLGSMASWSGIPTAPMYTASKHAVLGLMRSLSDSFSLQDIRIACIHPFFADTAIVPMIAKLVLAGVPLTPVPRIAGAIVYAATNPDPETSGCAWLLTDDGPVFLLPREEFKFGVYKMIDERANSLLTVAKGGVYYFRLTADILHILRKPLSYLGVAILSGMLAWNQRETLAGLTRSH